MLRNLTLLIALTMMPFGLIAQWSDDPSVNLQISDLGGEQTIPKVAVGPDGHYYVGYFSSSEGQYDMYLQRLDNEGNPQWPGSGILISDHPTMSWLTDWDLTVDHENHAILTWPDEREGDLNIVAYRIGPDEEFAWGDDGILLSNSPAFEAAPKVTVTGDNNAVFAWEAEGEVIIQKVSPNGTKEWGEWGITLSAEDEYTWPQLIPVGDDDVILKLYEDSGPFFAPIRHILAQRYDGNGDPVWDEKTLVYDGGEITGFTQILPMVNDGDDGFYIAWHDYTLSGTEASVWLQHVNNEGEPQFVHNGVLLSDANHNNQLNPSIALAGNGEYVYVFWNERNANQNMFGIFGQKVATNGDLQWGTGGHEIFGLGNQSLFTYFALPAGAEDVVILYDYDMGATNYGLRAARIDGDGEFAWSPEVVDVSDVASSKMHPDMASFNDDQWVFAWGDDRDGPSEIYAQNLLPDGQLGVPETVEQYTLTITMEGEGQVLVDGIAYTEPLTFEEGELVELEAIAEEGWTFHAWAGDVESMDPVETIAMDADKQVMAIFLEDEEPQYALTLEADPASGGEVSGAGDYEAGDSVTIEAHPADGYVFHLWLDEVENTFAEVATHTFEMPADDLHLIAVFQQETNVVGQEQATVTLYPNPGHNQVSVTSDVPIAQIEVLDLKGTAVMSRYAHQVYEYHLDVSALNAGVHVVRIQGDNGIMVKRLIISR